LWSKQIRGKVSLQELLFLLVIIFQPVLHGHSFNEDTIISVIDSLKGMRRYIRPLPYIPSWGAQEKKIYIYTFNFYLLNCTCTVYTKTL
jgi:hypothetical protein